MERAANLRSHQDDPILDNIGEELGFMGAMLLIGLFAVIIWRALRIARLSEDMYGRLIATGDRRRARVPGVREHRDDHRHHAGHRHPAAVREFRQQFAGSILDGDRPVGEYPRSFGGRAGQVAAPGAQLWGGWEWPSCLLTSRRASRP